MGSNKVFFAGLIFLILLLFKNPLSANNIISDLEPTPDSIHYLGPLASLLSGKGLVISYQGRSIPTQVPPLYTLVLLPIYIISHQIRFFYITNVLLTIFSAILFYKIVTKLFLNKIISSILYFAFISNYVTYWYPQVAMAENLLTPLYLSSIWLLLQPITRKKVFLVAFLAVGFFATKYIAGILSVALILVFIIKIIFSKISKNEKKVYLLILFSSLFVLFLSFFSKIDKTSVLESNKHTGLFSGSYLKDNLTRLIAGIMGGPMTVAGRDFIILPIIVGMSSLIAIFVNLLNAKNRLLSIYFFVSIIGTVYFISTFFVVEGRYLFEFIPAFLIIFGIFLETICNFFNKLGRKAYSLILLCFVYIAIILNVYHPVLNQLKINFVTGEKALNYYAIETMNSYTNKLPSFSKPIIITVLSPYLIDFYSNHKYKLLPFSKSQHFFPDGEKVWGIDPKQPLLEIYKEYLLQNRQLYLSDYETSYKLRYQIDIKEIKDNFKLNLVAIGCDNRCNLYKLELKK